MQSPRSPRATPGGSGHATGVRVPASPPGPGAPSAGELAHLPQAERAARALAEGRRERETVSLERAFLEHALDYRHTLRVLVSAVVPGFADWCFVDLVDASGIPRRVEVAHADPQKAPLATEMRAIAFGPGWATPGAQAIRDHAPRLFREVTNELLQWATTDERHLAVLRAIKPNSLLSAPLMARDRPIGAITIIRSAMQPPLSEEDLAYAEAIAVSAALALDNARWFQGEKAARAAAQEQADRECHLRIEAEKAVLRLRRLEAVSATLSAVLAPEAIARLAVDNGLSLLEPSSATVMLASPDGAALDLIHQQGWPDDLARELRRVRSDAPALVAEAYRTQTAIWSPSAEALAQAYPNAADLARRMGDRAWASAPLRADGRTLGAVSLGFARPRDLDADERRFFLTVVQQMAQALERARLRGG